MKNGVQLQEAFFEKVYNVFTLAGTKIMKGAKVEEYKLKAVDKSISAVKIGEEGRGRKLFIVPTIGAGEVVDRVRLVKTKSGKPKFVAVSDEPEKDMMIIVLMTPFGYRGHNYHESEKEVIIIGHGIQADGLAGRVGDGDNYIIISPIPNNILVRISGRVYGNPDNIKYVIKSNNLVEAYTGEEIEWGLDEDI
ncbi:MAG: hypothetical protein ABIM30_00570 [candidate division WOR-3 bacterium]